MAEGRTIPRPKGVSLGTLSRAAERIGLPAWFVALDLLMPTWTGATVGVDSRIYQAATITWLAGGDPWKVEQLGVPYAAAPWNLLTYVPTSLLPLDVSVALWMLLGLLAAVAVLRRLGLPLWWLAFPPLVQALWNGNDQPIVLAGLLIGGGWGVTVATAMKLYAIVPAVLGYRWREVALCASVLLVAAVALPWGSYLSHDAAVSDIATHAWNGSATAFAPLIPFTVAALLVLRNEGWEWFAIPAVWPGTQPYYSIFAIPALTNRWMAAAFALPVPLVPPLAVVGYAAYRLLRRPPPSRVTEQTQPLGGSGNRRANSLSHAAGADAAARSSTHSAPSS